MECQLCGINPDEYVDAGDLRYVPCGLLLCDDCRYEHHFCEACAQELSYNEPEYWG